MRLTKKSSSRNDRCALCPFGVDVLQHWGQGTARSALYDSWQLLSFRIFHEMANNLLPLDRICDLLRQDFPNCSFILVNDSVDIRVHWDARLHQTHFAQGLLKHFGRRLHQLRMESSGHWKHFGSPDAKVCLIFVNKFKRLHVACNQSLRLKFKTKSQISAFWGHKKPTLVTLQPDF